MKGETTEPRILGRDEHSLSRKSIDSIALKVLYRLHRKGKLAYLCGGAVRDLLLGRVPKDYDVATDARPPEVRRLFRNSRIIGRRFRLAHIYFKEGIVEVSTFRRDPDPEAQASAPGEILITDDNVFGTPREDAFRRDFTVNALFYSIADYSVIDYVGGIDDLEGRQIRVIGDPEVRFREDPIRMTRACELAARLGFSIAPGTQQGIYDCRREIEKASTARLTEELLQVLRCGQAGRALQWMVELGLADVLLPELEAMRRAEGRGLGRFDRILPVLDRRVASGEELPEIALIAALLLPAVAERRQEARRERGGALSPGALQGLIEEAIAPFFARYTLSRLKAEQVTQAILALAKMRRLRDDGQRRRLAHKPYFPTALLLLEIVVEATGEGGEELQLWRRAAPRRGGGKGKPRSRRRPRRRRRRRARRPAR